MAKRAPTAAEKTLSGALIAGAFSFIGLAIFASASFADKVSERALFAGNLVGTVAVAALLMSIIFGGKGTMKVSTGPGNAFNLQAWTGLAGVIMLLIAAGLFAFNPKPETSKVHATILENHIRRLEAEQHELASEVRDLRKQQQLHQHLSDVRPVKRAKPNATASPPPR